MTKRLYHMELVEAKWSCGRCAASGNGKNAQAVAANHHDSTGHPTTATMTSCITYGSRGVAAGGQQQRSML